MKSLLILVLAVTLGYGIHAQMPAAPAPGSAALLEIKAKNEVLLQQQAATLVTLEELKLMATQLKIYSRRG